MTDFAPDDFTPGNGFAWGDVVKVPFPYTDRATRQRRPALVISAAALQRDHGLIWVAMITSAENRRWASDIAIDDLALAGLPAPSLIRTAKIATINARDAEKLGRLDASVWNDVAKSLRAQLGG